MKDAKKVSSNKRVSGNGGLTRKQNLIQTVKFVIFSATAGVIQTATFTLMNELGKLPYWPSYLTALILSVLYNFTVNRKFTFKSANNVPIAMLKVAAYYAVFTPASTLWGKALTDIGWNEYLVLFITMFINLSTEFLFNRFVVYRNSINTSSYALKEYEMNAIRRYIYTKKGQITNNPDRKQVLDELSAWAKPGGIVFAGDSITEAFAGSEFFNGFRVYNRGIGGDTSEGLLKRLETQIIPLAPAKVFILIGTNDLGQGRSLASIGDNINKIIEVIGLKTPDTKVYLLSVLPVNNKILFNRNRSIISLNTILESFDGNGVEYLDIFNDFADENDNLKPEFTYDGLHLSHKGYCKLAKLLSPYVEE